jgi:hypothetical protein
MATTTLTLGTHRSTDRDTEAEGAPAVSRWQQRAACREVPTALFFPSGNFARMEEK